MLEECLIEHCYLTTCGTVNEYRVEDIHLYNLVTHVLCVCWETRTQDLLVVIEVDTITIQHKVIYIADTYDIQFQTTRLHEELLLCTDLFKQHTANSTDTTDKDIEDLVF